MQSAVYPNEMRIEDALQRYFATYHFADGGYRDKYFKIKIGPVLIPVPNTKSRIAAVKLHDIHHLLTEYPATWKGEVEIGAWEIASGCGNFMVAWLLNFGSFGVGVFLYPKALFRAFMMGRHVKSNLYHHWVYDQALLNKTVGKLRDELAIGRLKKNSLQDHSLFIVWVLLVFVELFTIGFLFCMVFD